MSDPDNAEDVPCPVCGASLGPGAVGAQVKLCSYNDGIVYVCNTACADRWMRERNYAREEE